MGYSCTKAAADTLAVIDHEYGKRSEAILLLNGRECFFERGREQPDGAITGRLMVLISTNECRYAGSVRIEPDGEITRFPYLTKLQRQAVVVAALDMAARNPNMLHSWGLPGLL